MSRMLQPGTSFLHAWRRRVEASANNVFLLQDGVALTFEETDRQAARIATGLREHSVRTGDPVLLGAGNSFAFVMAHLAIQHLGAVTTPLIAGASFDDLAFPANHSEGHILIADAQVYETVRARLGECPQIKTVILAGEARDGRATLADFSRLDPAPFVEEPASDLTPYGIVYTSGSSGRPKGVVIPSGAPLSIGRGLVDRLKLTADDTLIVPTPMAHSVGLVTALGGAVLTGARLALTRNFSPLRFWRDVIINNATLCCLFPAHLNLLMAAEADAPAYGETGLRGIFTHAVNEAFIRRFGVPLHMCWGMTETGALMAMSRGLTEAAASGYVGEPMPDTRIAAFDEDGNELTAGSQGELRLRHRHVMLRYHKDESATAETLVDGWVRSGDLGWIDADGRVHYAGRIKTMIKRSGENISPDEIESVFASLPGVSECLVYGTPDPVRTEEVVACVAMQPNAPFDPTALLAQAAHTLSRWKLPRFVIGWQGALPRLANGKIDRRAIIAACDFTTAWDARAAAPSQLPQSQRAAP